MFRAISKLKGANRAINQGVMARTYALNRSNSEQFVIKSKQTNKLLSKMHFSKTLIMAYAIASKVSLAVELNAQSGSKYPFGYRGPDKPT